MRVSLAAVKHCLLVLLLCYSASVNAEFLLALEQGFDDDTPVMPVGGNQGLTIGQQRQNVIERAALIWEYYLQIPVDITLAVAFRELECSSTSGVLGAAGPEWVDRSFAGAPLQDVWYSAPLALQLKGFRQAGDPEVDIRAQFNSRLNGDSSCLAGYSWYYGFDNQPEAKQLSLLTTVLHEVAHGLGFISLVGENSGGSVNGQFPLGSIDVFSRQLYDQDFLKFWSDLSDSQIINSSTNNGSLVWGGTLTQAFITLLDSGVSQGAVRMYAPTTWESGSSISHFDKAVSYRFQYGQEELMEPDETSNTISEYLTLSLMADLGWQLKTDFDGDGFLDGEDPQPLTANSNDTDGDGQDNNVDIDDDNDGMSDQFERANLFDPYDASDAGLDVDGDGASNLNEFLAGSNPRFFDQPPEFTGVQSPIRIDSTGAFTDYQFPGVSAIDASGEELFWQVLPLPPWRSGIHDLSLIAIDKYGYQTTESVQLQIRPTVFLSGFETVVEGDSTVVNIGLSGEAVSAFPLSVAYSVSGSATSLVDHSLESGFLSIASLAGDAFSYQVNLDAVPESKENLLVSLQANDELAVNEFSQLEVELLDSGDILQEVEFLMKSNGVAVSRVVQGDVLNVTALIKDTSDEVYSFDWSGSDDLLAVDTATGASINIDTASLPIGLYRLALSIVDVSNSANVSQSSISFVVDSSSGVDTDQDGVEDSFDGPAYDYLLQSASSNKNSFLLEAEPHLLLRLGDTALTANTKGAFLSVSFFGQDKGFEYEQGVYDFEIRNLAPGAEARILIPLTAQLTLNNRLRIYWPALTQSGSGRWQNFIENDANSIATALGTYSGFCPPFSDANFMPGINTGDDCLQLQLQDGGPNDADGAVNGVIQLVVGVASAQPSRSSGGGGVFSLHLLLFFCLLALGNAAKQGRTD